MARPPFRLVTLGAGTGQSMLLRGLCRPGRAVTAVVGVTDNGGHSGILRRSLGIPQVGDSRNCLVAAAEPDCALAALMDFRFDRGALTGVQLGNLIVAGLTVRHGSITEALEILGRSLQARARILPVSNGSGQVAGTLADGRRIVGEWDLMHRRPRVPLVRIAHRPRLEATPQVRKALREAEAVVLAPGSLFTGLCSVLVTRGVRETLCARPRLPIVFVCNLMTQPGQTDGFDAGRHVAVIEEHLGRRLDGVIVNGVPPPAPLARLYRKGGSEPVAPSGIPARMRCVKTGLVLRADPRTLRGFHRAAAPGMHGWLHLIRHDPKAVARGLREWLRQ